MADHLVTRHTREHRLYLSKDDLADLTGLPADQMFVTTVDKAPDRDDYLVRICLLESLDLIRVNAGALFLETNDDD
tara:strand:- start:382 stop:609 length:228 start_codon:yes stop_codon:yes gene_type:complete